MNNKTHATLSRDEVRRELGSIIQHYQQVLFRANKQLASLRRELSFYKIAAERAHDAALLTLKGHDDAIPEIAVEPEEEPL